MKRRRAQPSQQTSAVHADARRCCHAALAAAHGAHGSANAGPPAPRDTARQVLLEVFTPLCCACPAFSATNCPQLPSARPSVPPYPAGSQCGSCQVSGCWHRPAPPRPSRTLPFHSSSGQMECKYNVFKSEEPSQSNLKSRANISPCVCQGEPRAADGGVAFPSLPHQKAKNDKESFSHLLIAYSGYIKKGEIHLRSPPVTATKACDEFCIQNICTNYQHSSPLKALGGMDGVSPGRISPHCFPCTIHKYTCARVYFYQRARTCIHGEKTYKCLTPPVRGWRAGAAREGLLASLCRRGNVGLRCGGPAAFQRLERALSAQGDRHHSLVKRKTTLCRCNRPGKERNVPNANGD